MQCGCVAGIFQSSVQNWPTRFSADHSGVNKSSQKQSLVRVHFICCHHRVHILPTSSLNLLCRLWRYLSVWVLGCSAQENRFRISKGCITSSRHAGVYPATVPMIYGSALQWAQTPLVLSLKLWICTVPINQEHSEGLHCWHFCQQYWHRRPHHVHSSLQAGELLPIKKIKQVNVLQSPGWYRNK